MAKEHVVTALEKAIIKSSRDLRKGKKVSTEGLARLVSSYCRLQGIGRYGSQQADEDAWENGDPNYHDSLMS